MPRKVKQIFQECEITLEETIAILFTLCKKKKTKVNMYKARIDMQNVLKKLAKRKV